MRKILSTLLIFFLTLPCFISDNVVFANTLPEITAPFGVLMDYETGQILYNKNGEQRVFPASTTKAWTAYVVIKNVEDLSERVLIESLEPVEGTSMYLQNGESFTIKELLQGLMITSANDAAVVLARHISGSDAEFAKLMTDEAKAIGATGTNFNNPHGLPDDIHYTTPIDMALMSRQAMNNDIFREIVKTESVRFPKSETCFTERYFTNTNKLLTSQEQTTYKNQVVNMKYDIVDGIKTGYTNAAGRCLLSSAIKDNRRMIATVFKAEGDNVFLDSRTLLDYGFDNFESKLIVNKDSYDENLKISFSKEKFLNYTPKYSYKVVVPINSGNGEYTVKEELFDVDLPITKNQVVGKLDIYNGDELEHTVDLISTGPVNSIFAFMDGALINILKVVAFLFVALLITGLSIRHYNLSKRKKRRNSNVINYNFKRGNTGLFSKKNNNNNRRKK